MTNVLRWIGLLGGLLVGGAVLFVLWASSGRLPDEKRAQIRTYADFPDPSAPPESLTVTTYNVGYLSGMTNNEPVVRPNRLFYTNMEQVVGFLRRTQPDIVAAQEIDFGGARVAHVHQLDTLAARLGYPAAAQSVNWDERYLPFPYGRPAVHFGRTLSGQAILSRFPIRGHVRNVLPRPPQPFYRDIFYLDRLAQVALVDLGGRPLVVINVHLEAFNADTRKRQARRVNGLYRRLADRGIPALLVGDFNSTLSSAETGASAGPADPTMQLLVKGTGLQAAVPPGAGGTSGATYPASSPTRQIDHILYPPSVFRPSEVRRWCGTPDPPSDHCAVTATLHFKSSMGESSTRAWPGYEDFPSLQTRTGD
jgi:endonuclease/exonuclease/phosphatase family metal-dependent hydrolase